MKERKHRPFMPWPSPEQVREVLELGERAIEAHQDQAVRLARDITLGAMTPRNVADESSDFYGRVSRDWAETLRILFRREDSDEKGRKGGER